MGDEDSQDTESSDSFLRELAHAPSRAPDPERIGRFRITGRLGAGGMGIVYRAEDESLRRPVAIKVLPPDVQGDDERRKRLVREARAAAAVTHPNLAAVHEVGEADGRVYIAMELVEGQSLRALLSGPLPTAAALDIALQIARGLSRAHRAGIVHRDLKPENVVVSDDGHVKILDFGLAKIRAVEAANESAFAKGETVTHEGRVMGTPAYMAPEQARGQEVTASADVFAFGVMLYEMLAGHRPFAGSTTADIAIAIDRGLPDPVSPSHDPLILKCLSRNAADRPADGGALVKALADGSRPSLPTTSAGDEDMAPTIGARTPDLEPRKPLGRRSLVVAGVMAVLALAGVVLSQTHASPAAVSVDAAPAVVAKPVATTLTDLPLPPTKIPEASAEYEAGMQCLRDDSSRRAQTHFSRALELDPGIAAAHLRLALTMLPDEWAGTTPRHEHFERALTLRAQLNERDRSLAEALEPVLLRTREDSAEAARRVSAIHQRWPGDVEIIDFLIWLTPGDANAQLALGEQAVGLDPHDGAALEYTATALRNLGRNADARAMYERAASVSLGSVDPLERLAELDSDEGKCDELERHAKMSAERGLVPTTMLIEAFLANGRSDEQIRQVIEQMTAAQPRSQRRAFELGRLAALSIVRGDFVTARAYADERASLVAADPEMSQSLNLRYTSTAQRMFIAEEVGDLGEERRLARAHVALADGWAGSTYDDGYIFFMRRVAAGNDPVAIAAFEKKRDASAEDWLAKKTQLPLDIWFMHYTGGPANSRTRAEAQHALELLPRYGGFPNEQLYDADLDFGSILVLADRTEEAVPYLRRALASCARYHHAVRFAQLANDLGDILESQGDHQGACASYAKVIGWWGHAKPRSVNADKARARITALRCPAAPPAAPVPSARP